MLVLLNFYPEKRTLKHSIFPSSFAEESQMNKKRLRTHQTHYVRMVYELRAYGVYIIHYTYDLFYEFWEWAKLFIFTIRISNHFLFAIQLCVSWINFTFGFHQRHRCENISLWLFIKCDSCSLLCFLSSVGGYIFFDFVVFSLLPLA